MKPRRSVLYMPGSNARALDKARTLDCDAIIFDLEDAVAPDAKAQARAQVVEAIQAGGYGHRELIVRMNGLDTPWGDDDMAAVRDLTIAGVLIPKVESIGEVQAVYEALDEGTNDAPPLWLMVETPRGVIDLERFAEHPSVEVLVMGTSDLVKELRARHTVNRANLHFALQRCVMIARLLGIDILDGVHLDFKNQETFELACSQGRDMGFDGKTLIHPTQIEAANRVFGFGEAEIEHASAVLDVWDAALKAGKGVAVLDGKLVENLHAEEARRVVAFAQALAARAG